jgi:hypothetical protein
LRDGKFDRTPWIKRLANSNRSEGVSLPARFMIWSMV